MTYIRWTFRIVILSLLVGVLHYTLPQRDIVRITNTEVRRVDFGVNSIFWSNSGAGDAVETVNRDVLFIETAQPDGDVIVYRNEDTGIGWPPYFKFDTADLQAEAGKLISSADAPKWVALRHYGWRNTWLSIFPNATSIKEIDSPEQRLIPWFNIVFLTVLILGLITIWRLWRNFWARRVDPVLEDIDEAGEAAKSRFWTLFGRGRR